MPKREVVTKVSIMFTDTEWNELTNLYQQLHQILDDDYPEVTEPILTSLIANLRTTAELLES